QAPSRGRALRPRFCLLGKGFPEAAEARRAGGFWAARPRVGGERCARDSAFWEKASQKREGQEAQAAVGPAGPEEGWRAAPASLAVRKRPPGRGGGNTCRQLLGRQAPSRGRALRPRFCLLGKGFPEAAGARRAGGFWAARPRVGGERCARDSAFWEKASQK